MTLLQSHIDLISQGTVLTEEQMFDAITFMMSGDANEPEMESFLRALSARGEHVDEITGAAKALRAQADLITAPDTAIDCCGTGGDGSHTYNISTAVAFVSAACGVSMAKHGNRAASSKSGAADVLEALGINLDLSQNKLEQALEEIGFCFLMAPKHHAAVKHVAAVRKKIGSRTIFNLLGPLANPADTKRQLIGVFDRKWIEPMAQTLHKLGTTKAWIVHGADGLDEITTTDDTHIAVLENGKIETRTLTPEDFGVPYANPSDLKGGDARYNASALTDLLDGLKSPYRDIVLVNTAAVLMIADKAQDPKEAVQIAAKAIDSGQAKNILNQYIAFSNESVNGDKI